eukprot:767615-Hanusia_phi.AAC.3
MGGSWPPCIGDVGKWKWGKLGVGGGLVLDGNAVKKSQWRSGAEEGGGEDEREGRRSQAVAWHIPEVMSVQYVSPPPQKCKYTILWGEV